MDPSYAKKKIVDLTDAELTALGFMGDNVVPGVKRVVDKVKEYPDKLRNITCFMLECLKQEARQDTQPPSSPFSPASPTRNDAETPFSVPSSNPDARTVVGLDLVSEYEKNFYYHGISGDPPKLLWRSNLESDPFPTPPAGVHFYKIPQKTAHGVFNTPLNELWDDAVVPQIKVSMKNRSIMYSAIKTARFSILKDGGEEMFGPVVIWIAVRPVTTNVAAVRDATSDILDILTASQITGVVVEWYEGSVVRLAGPPLMRVEDPTNAKFGLNHPFNVGLGIPIARQSDGFEGTLTFLFEEVKTIGGEPSDRILALTNKHVVSLDTSTDYVLDEADPQHILVCGKRRFARAIAEIQKAVTSGARDAVRLVEKLSDTPKGDASTLRRARNALEDKDEDNADLKILSDDVNANWTDTNGRRLGVVDWAPRISVAVDDGHYTRDIATFAVDKEKLGNFERNIVDLGNQYTAGQLEDLFWPFAAVREGRTIPADLQLPIRAALTRHRLRNPDTEDRNGEPLSIVAKYGNATKLTLGRCSGMDAYICTDLGEESREVVVYNYNHNDNYSQSQRQSQTSGSSSGDFSGYGDSGSLIFSGDGDGVAVLHSGMPRGGGYGCSNHVSFGTPLWWVLREVRGVYPDARFFGIAYDDE